MSPQEWLVAAQCVFTDAVFARVKGGQPVNEAKLRPVRQVLKRGGKRIVHAIL
jgi:hypothetical protein